MSRKAGHRKANMELQITSDSCKLSIKLLKNQEKKEGRGSNPQRVFSDQKVQLTTVNYYVMVLFIPANFFISYNLCM